MFTDSEDMQRDACLGSSKVSVNNRITLPKDLVEKLDVKEGDLVLFYDDGVKFYIVKA